jgi:hypothetical protein
MMPSSGLMGRGGKVSIDFLSYAETFQGPEHLRRIEEEVQLIAGDALAASPQQPGISSGSRLEEKP